jgi:hypothetical protein
MVKLRSRLARLSAGGAGIALVAAGLALSVPGSAQAQGAQPQTTPVSCAHEGNGYTGGPHVSGTKWSKQADNCGNFWLIVAYNTSTYYQGYYKKNGIWIKAAEGPYYCAAGSICNDIMVKGPIIVGTELTVNSSNGGNAHIEVGY